MQVHYRYVPYGTRFAGRPDERPSAEGAGAEHQDKTVALLYENEIATDVGQRYWGRDKDGAAEELPVIDHHFAWEGQFPSASAAVLHSAAKVHEWWNRCSHKGFQKVWLVTHRTPDFDALASLYLVRSLREENCIAGAELGIASDAWRDLTAAEHKGGKQRFDWFSAPEDSVAAQARWRLGLAVAASLTDQCRRFECPRTQASPAVFYAALQRGRAFLESGGVVFFDEFRDAMVKRHCNPVTDALFGAKSEFAREVALLADEMPKYDRDVARARRAIVAIPRYETDFKTYYESRCGTPLLRADGSLDPIHVSTDAVPRAADGIFIRDPESMLFKDLARIDSENSFLRKGFLFTAVAKSSRKSGSAVNSTDYYFALDPERAGQHTLYPVWARIQEAELRALSEETKSERRSRVARDGFEGRAGTLGGLLADPWFDGPNFRTTIVVTPDGGTQIGPSGTAADLADDPVAGIVREVLTSVFSAAPRCIDFKDGRLFRDSGGAADEDPEETTADYRFCRVLLLPGLDLSSEALDRGIGEQMWDRLHSGKRGLPDDFAERHFVRGYESLAVWSRSGVAFAFHDTPEGQRQLDRLSTQFGKIVDLLHRAYSAGQDQGEAARVSALEAAEGLLREINLVRQDLAMARGSVAMRRFVDAIGFHDTLATVRDMLASQRSIRIAHSTQKVLGELQAGQEKVELLETLIVTLYAVEMGHFILGGLGGSSESVLEVRILCGLGMVIVGTVWIGLSSGRKKGERGRKPFSTLSLIPWITLLILAFGIMATFPPFAGWYRALAGTATSGGATHESGAVVSPVKPSAESAPVTPLVQKKQ